MAVMKKYTIDGIDCGDCAARIERRLQAVEGLEEASVNFATRIVRIDPELYQVAEREIRREEPDARLEAEAGGAQDHGAEREGGGAQLPLLRIAAALLLFGAGVAMHFLEPGLSLPIPGAGDWLLASIAYGAAYLLVGYPVLVRAVRNLLRGTVFDEHFLMSIATLGAIGIGEWAEAAGVMLFYAVGEMLQERAVGKTRKSIRALMDLRPDYAHLLRDGRRQRVAAESLTPGDRIEVLPGERIPVDGEVLEGRSYLDTSALTGESVPQAADPGDRVLSGSVNGEGLLTIRVERSFEQSSASRIVQLVEEAASRKARTEQFITRFARIYTPVVVALAAGVALLPPLLAGGGWNEWLYRAFVVLVVSCPCALVISVPLGYFGGIGAASRSGVLVKGANYLDQLSRTALIAFDKTGTVTRGVFEVLEAVPRNGSSEEELWRWASAAEADSSHPIARSIRAKAREKGVPETGKSTAYREYRARGVEATVAGQRVLAGSDRMMHEWGIEHSDCDAQGTIVYVALEGEYLGYLRVGDELKAEVPELLAELRRLGMQRGVLLTGDERGFARTIAERAGFDEWQAELLPEDKITRVEELESRYPDYQTAFVGDGVNDAPVLARAKLGIAMGGLGSDAAIEAADVVLMEDRLQALPRAIRIAHRTRRIVSQNIAGALAVKIIFLGLGTAGLVTMWGAVFADVGVTLLAVFNSLRALVYRAPLG
jgi:Cd2+/Zn2+-exporting ATPase